MGSLASVLLHKRLHYRPELFRQGLEKCGYKCTENYQPPRGKDDCLVIWNRMNKDEQRARQYERKNNPVFITENAWLGPEDKEGHFFALCLNHHNGVGDWHVGIERRWPKLNVGMKPWRKSGGHILVLPQRGIGEKGIAQPPNWTKDIIRKLKRVTDRPIMIREHPGKRPHRPLTPELRDCHAVVTWASGAAIKAIVEGIPVFYGLPQWIAGPAAVMGVRNVEYPYTGDREYMLERLAWAQWTGKEIATGVPFRCLLRK